MTVLIFAAAVATGTRTAELPAWMSCSYRLAHAPQTSVIGRRCARHIIYHPPRKARGWQASRCAHTSRWRIRCTKWPRFPIPPKPAPRGIHTSLYITGYSWGCGTPNGITATGHVPTVGTISSDTLPFGTRIFVPSLNYSGVVDDRGVGTGGLDLFLGSCAATYAITGWREVIIF